MNSRGGSIRAIVISPNTSLNVRTPIPTTPLFATSESETISHCHFRLFVIPWTIVRHAPLSMGFSRQEYWSGLPFPPPWDLSDPGIEPKYSALDVNFLPSETPGIAIIKRTQITVVDLDVEKSEHLSIVVRT